MEQNRTKTNKNAMLDALIKSLGIVQTACKTVGISRETHYKWYNEDEDYKANVDDVANIALDFVESQLFKQIKEGNTTASIFYLKTKGKRRGYVERIEHENQHEFKEPSKVKIEFGED